jgi:putative NADH-flavin reductase
MRVTVFGATGRLGSEIVQAARDRGFTVTAHGRTLKSGGVPGIESVTGDVWGAIHHADAVVVTFGPRSPSDAPFCASETKKILAGMRRRGVSRILCVTGAMVGEYPGNRTWGVQRLATWIQRRYRKQMEDRALQEMLIRCSGMNWTVFKPPRLTTQKPHGSVRVGPAVRVGLLSSIGRADLARVMLDEVEQGRFPGQCVFVARSRS